MKNHKLIPFVTLLSVFVLLTTSCTGVQGLAGPAGEKGPPGDVGAIGATGPAGANGATGANGAAGTPGAQGGKGDAGATGPAGAAGIQGPAGPIGTTGPAGAAGIQGPAGPAGAQGPQGPAGTGGTGTVPSLGEWDSARLPNTVYLAITDGFVVASFSADGNFATLIGKTGPALNALYVRAREYATDGINTKMLSITMPVKKNQYWSIETVRQSGTSGTVNVTEIHWIPLGN